MLLGTCASCCACCAMLRVLRDLRVLCMLRCRSNYNHINVFEDRIPGRAIVLSGEHFHPFLLTSIPSAAGAACTPSGLSLALHGQLAAACVHEKRGGVSTAGPLCLLEMLAWLKAGIDLKWSALCTPTSP